MLQSTSDGVFLLDQHWCFTYLNAAAERLLGREASELVGLGVWDEFPEVVGSTVDLAYRRARDTGAPVTVDEYYAPLDTTFKGRVFPEGLGVAVFMRDVDEDRRLRKQQREHAELTRANLDSLPAHTVVVDQDGTITSTNQPWETFGTQEGGNPARWGGRRWITSVPLPPANAGSACRRCRSLAGRA